MCIFPPHLCVCARGGTRHFSTRASMVDHVLRFLRTVFVIQEVEDRAMEESFVKIMNMLKR